MTATIVGAKELERLLLTLPDKVYRRVVRKAVNKSTTSMLKAARKLAPASEQGDFEGAGRGLYRKALIKKLRSYFVDGVVVSIIGAGVNRGTDNRGNLSHLLEHGHRIANRGTLARDTPGARRQVAPKSRVKGGRGRGTVLGFVRPQPHLGPAFRATVVAAAAKMQRELGRGIEMEARKL